MLAAREKSYADFDMKTYAENLRATKPPYRCPLDGCGRVYKSYCGINQHLLHFDHSNPNSPPPPTPSSSRKSALLGSRKKRKNVNKLKGGSACSTPARSPSPPPRFEIRTPPRENLSYAESQRQVEVEMNGSMYRINIYEPLEIISQGEIDNWSNAEKEESLEKGTSPNTSKNSVRTKTTSQSKNNSKQQIMPVSTVPKLALPEATFTTLDDYVKPKKPPSRNNTYYRFIEKTPEELDDEVEYDMDEEDYAWLGLVNEQRQKDRYPCLTQEIFEMLMDRFEKEAFFQSQTCGRDPLPSIDEDAVCGICMDGECQNSNVILFCDMCNLAVHQECYGVPYIPEGQWLCRRCLQSPSRPVDCCLCPNKGGAFKQTDDGRWVHVVCALWIPEVGFANTVFLEPIDCIGRIPSARWKLTCYICKQRSLGACIQCHRTNCYTAFHVTCAQQAGLFMKIEPVRDGGSAGAVTVSVRKTAYCDVHTPANMEYRPMINNGADDTSPSPADVKAQSKMKMKRARKILAEKRNAVPVVSIPIIPKERVEKIAETVTLKKKSKLIRRLLSYWTLKRQARNGVPLLRRLQSNHMSRSRDHDENDENSSALKEQMKYWQRLRQDLEKARLLVELIRKREKLKREQLRYHEMVIEMKLQPFIYMLRNALEQLEEIDTQKIFAEPVPLDEVPDYLDYVKNPMDFSTMKRAVDNYEYKSLDAFERDFDLIVNNCMAYNGKDTIFYRAAIKLRDQGGAVIRGLRRNIEKVGIEPATGVHHSDTVLSEKEVNCSNEADLPEGFLPVHIRRSLPLEQQLKMLLDKLDEEEAAKKNKKSRLCKQIRRELGLVRRKMAQQRASSVTSQGTGTSDGEESTADSKHEPTGEAVGSSRHASPDKTPTEAEAKAKVDNGAAGNAKVDAEAPKLSAVGHTGPVRGRGRGRPRGRGGRRSMRSESQKEPPDITSDVNVNLEVECTSPTRSEKDKSEEQSTSNPTTPTGVNRRTAVLFKKSAKKNQKSAASGSNEVTPTQNKKADDNADYDSPPKLDIADTNGPVSEGHGNVRDDKNCEEDHEVILPSPSKVVHTKKKRGPKRGRRTKGQGPCIDSKDSEVAALPTSPTTRKRSASTAGLSSPRSPGPRSPPAKRSLSMSEQPPHLTREVQFSSPTFTEYRQSTAKIGSDMDTTSESGSTDCGMSDTSSDSGDSSDEGGDGRGCKKGSKDEDGSRHRLEPLDLVWAKCRGYPWYPALIIDPKMPRTGYFHNGVPIPVPPEDVLSLRDKHPPYSFLVLFFDTKRTWQWLPPNKLNALGDDKGKDRAKLNESKKPNVRKAVRSAYDKAIAHKCRVTGETVSIAEITDAADAAGLTTTADEEP